MNSKHRRTYDAVLADPVSPSIAWADVEAMLVASGCRLIEGAGSRVRFELGGVVGSFHRPHPANEAKRYQIRDVRDFLKLTGIAP